jgi:hypothetical protein
VSGRAFMQRCRKFGRMAHRKMLAGRGIMGEITIRQPEVPTSLSTNGCDRGTQGMDLISVTSRIRRLACHWWNR